jgi:ParB family chromosome partitioning protein
MPMQPPSPTLIALTEIDSAALPRDRSLADPDAMAELQHSIAVTGLRQPIEVWQLRSPRPPFRYGLISGFRRLAACRGLGHSSIAAFLRSPSSIAGAMADMVAENEVRSQITPWEKGRFILATVDEGHFDTPDAAVAALYPAQSRQTRARLRNFALVAEVLDRHLSTPERLTIRQMERLAAALRTGWEDLMAATLAPLRSMGLESQWAALQPLLTESLSGEPAPANPRPRRLLHLKQGLTIRREMTRTGWILRFSGPEARNGGLMDDVMDEVERLFQVR